LSFYASGGNTGGSNITGGVDVKMDGTTILSKARTELSQDIWKFLTVNFTVTTLGNHTLSFVGTGTGSGQLLYLVGLNSIFILNAQDAIDVKNGTFESPAISANSTFGLTTDNTPNWVITQPNNVLLLNNSTAYSTFVKIPYPSGNQCVIIQGTSSIYQNIYFNAGAYRLFFNVSKASDFFNNLITVNINNSVIYTLTGFPLNGWNPITADFTISTAGTYRLSFNGTDNNIIYKVALDYINILNLTYSDYSWLNLYRDGSLNSLKINYSYNDKTIVDTKLMANMARRKEPFTKHMHTTIATILLVTWSIGWTQATHVLLRTCSLEDSRTPVKTSCSKARYTT
jgi:hypothetical protein